jgi:hypothetical protein
MRRALEIIRFNFDDNENRFSGLPMLVEYIDGRAWRLHRDVSYRCKDGRTSTVREGFVFDFASVPRFFWRIFPPAGDGRNLYGVAATWHDWLYRHGRIEGQFIRRKLADAVFLEIMLYIRVSPCVAKLMWAFVRVFGGSIWNQYRKGDGDRENMDPVLIARSMGCL